MDDGCDGKAKELPGFDASEPPSRAREPRPGHGPRGDAPSPGVAMRRARRAPTGKL